MYPIIFEVYPHNDQKVCYFEQAEQVHETLHRQTGFFSMLNDFRVLQMEVKYSVYPAGNQITQQRISVIMPNIWLLRQGTSTLYSNRIDRGLQKFFEPMIFRAHLSQLKTLRAELLNLFFHCYANVFKIRGWFKKARLIDHLFLR